MPRDVARPKNSKGRTPLPNSPIVPAGQTSHDLKTMEVNFTCFPKLPLELRREIWRHSMPGPRNITIVHYPADMRLLRVLDIDDEKHPWWRCRAYGGAVPTVLHVNKESRSATKEFFELTLHEQTRGFPVYLNFDRDTLCFRNERDLKGFYGRKYFSHLRHSDKEVTYMEPVEQKVQSLAIYINAEHLHRIVRMWNTLDRFTNLKSLTVGRPFGVDHANDDDARATTLMRRWSTSNDKYKGGPLTALEFVWLSQDECSKKAKQRF